MKRMFLLLTAAAMIAASPASAGDEAVASGLVTIALYDGQCQKVPASVIAMAERSLAQVPASIVRAAIPLVQAEFVADGRANWCEKTKEKIAKAVVNFSR